MLIDKRLSWPQAALTLLLVIVIGYLFIHKQLLDDETKWSPYSSAHLLFNDAYKNVISDYADSVDPKAGYFRFSESEGSKKGVRLWFPEYADIIIRSESYYQENRCTSEAKDSAHLFISTAHGNAIHKLVNGVGVSSKFQIQKGDELSVELINTVQAGCGVSDVRIYQDNRIDDYPEFFIVIWCVVIVLCITLGLPLLVPLFGALVNALLVAVSLTVEPQTLVALLYTTLLSIILCGLWFIALALSVNRLIRTLLLFALLLAVSVPVVIFGVHYAVFDVPPTVDTIHAILQSHKNQIIEFFQNILGWQYVLALVLSICAVIALIFVSTKVKPNRKIAFVFGLLLVAIGFRDVSVHLQMNSMLHIVNSGISSYFYELEAFQELNDSRDYDSEVINASTDQTDTTLVVVIGESANKTHFSSYGYPLKTTPVSDRLVAQGDMLKFNAAYANHIYSNPTISRTLTQASNYNGLRWTESLSIINLANAANINTAWISNKLKFGPWDNVMSVIGDDAQRTIHINTKVGEKLVSDRFDAALVPLVEQALTELSATKVIFVHLQGSHVGYSARYPDEAAVFNSQHESAIFGNAPKVNGYNNQSVNQYDNSIRYTDSVIGQVLDLLKSKDAPTAMLYFSDHGESVYTGKSHNAALFEYEMAEIPMLFWANPAWQKSYKKKWTNLKSNLDSVFSNDHVFEMVAGLLSINSQYNNAVNDISSAQYQAPIKPTTLHGKMGLDQDDNKNYWLTKNVQALQAAKPNLMLSAGVESVGDATQFLSRTLGKAYIDIEFVGGDKNKIFLVLPKPLTPISLKKYLNELAINDLNQVVFRLNEVTEKAISVVIDELNLLVSDFGVNSSSLVLLHPSNLDVSLLPSTGIEIGSYLLDELDVVAIERVLDIIDAQLIQSVLIAAPVYPKTQEMLFSLIESDDVNIVIDASQQFAFYKKSTAADLHDIDYFSDPRIVEVLLDYQSMFSF